MNLQSLILIFIEEWINVKLFWEIECIIDFLKSAFLFIKNHSINLEKEGFWSLLNPSSFLNTYNFAFVISVVINVRNDNLFEGLVKFFVFDVNKKQTEKFFLFFVELD